MNYAAELKAIIAKIDVIGNHVESNVGDSMYLIDVSDHLDSVANTLDQAYRAACTYHFEASGIPLPQTQGTSLRQETLEDLSK